MSISTANPQVATLTRYRFVAVGSETSVSGVDANGSVLAYVAGKEQVYMNGVLLVRGQDYTATNGTSITGLSALAANDVIEVLTFSEFVIANAVDQNLVNAKGDLIVATADNTVTNVAVGTNNHQLLADSAQTAGVKWGPSPTSTLTTTGDILYASSANTLARLGIGSTGQALTVSGGVPAWATPTTGSMTLLSTTTLSGASTTVSSINQTYTNLIIVINNATLSNLNLIRVQANGSTTLSNTGFANLVGASFSSSPNGTLWDTGSTSIYAVMNFQNYTNTSYSKQGNYVVSTSSPVVGAIGGYLYASNTAISSFTFTVNTGTLTGGQVLIYGVK